MSQLNRFFLSIEILQFEIILYLEKKSFCYNGMDHKFLGQFTQKFKISLKIYLLLDLKFSENVPFGSLKTWNVVILKMLKIKIFR